MKCTNKTFGWYYKKVVKALLKAKRYGYYNKGGVNEIINYTIDMKIKSIQEPKFYNRVQPLDKLREELKLYNSGAQMLSDYVASGIKWWNYIEGDRLINTYPTYLQGILDMQVGPSRNNVIYLGEKEWNTYSSQIPCISQINFQVNNNKLTLIITQRSADAMLGLPADIFQMFLVGQAVAINSNLEFDRMIFNINNLHMYKNHEKEARRWLKNWLKFDKKYNFELNT